MKELELHAKNLTLSCGQWEDIRCFRCEQDVGAQEEDGLENAETGGRTTFERQKQNFK